MAWRVRTFGFVRYHSFMRRGHLATDGAKIRRHRQLAGLTIKNLADQSGVSPSRLSSIENGNGSLRPPTLKAIADRLGLAVADLVVEPAGPRSLAA
jgi:transcriptional regulator with XRE-family HTH domain